MTEGERYLLEQRLQDLQAARRDAIAFEAEVGRMREEVGRLRELLKLALGGLVRIDVSFDEWAEMRHKIEAELLSSGNSETGV